MDISSSRERDNSSTESFIEIGVARVASMSRQVPTVRHLSKPIENARTHRGSTTFDSNRYRVEIPSAFSIRADTEEQISEDDFTPLDWPPRLSTPVPYNNDLQDNESSSYPEEKALSSEEGPNKLEYAEMSEPIQNKSTNRRSIIDPTSVRLSFAGSINSLETPLPLEEGLQKLYKLYEQTTTQEVDLPYSVPITEIPLGTIADGLEAQLQEQTAALEKCADSLMNLNNTITRARQDMNNLEHHYSQAQEKANMRAMTPSEVQLRIQWLKEEITRINTDRERLLLQHHASTGECLELQERLAEGCRLLRGQGEDLKNFEAEIRFLKEENRHLKQQNGHLRQWAATQYRTTPQKMQTEVGVVGVDEMGEMQPAFVRNLPSPLRKLYSKISMPTQVGRKDVRSSKEDRRSSRVSFY